MSIREFENKKGTTYEVRFTYKDKYGRKNIIQSVASLHIRKPKNMSS